MSDKQLWAPWRMEFIKSEKPTGGCVFCKLLGEKKDRDNLILHRAKRTFVILNKYPYNNGHLMVVPNEHTSDLGTLETETSNELFRFGKECVKALGEIYGAEGYNLGMNLGGAAGAGIRDHLHLHIVPRWVGDTNFMPVIAETKAMPQHLLASYDQLHGFFTKLT